MPNGAVFASPTIGSRWDDLPGGSVRAESLCPQAGRRQRQVGVSLSEEPGRPQDGGWPFTSPVVGADGTIYQTLLYDSHLYAIDPGAGKVLWSVDLCDPALFGQTDEPDARRRRLVRAGPRTRWDHLCQLRRPVPAGGRSERDRQMGKRFGDVGGLHADGGQEQVVYAASDDGRVYVVASDGG